MKEDLILLMSSLFSFSFLVENLKKEIERYNNNPSEKSKEGLVVACALILMNDQSKGTLEGAEKIRKDIEEIEKLKNLINPNKQ